MDLEGGFVLIALLAVEILRAGMLLSADTLYYMTQRLHLPYLNHTCSRDERNSDHTTVMSPDAVVESGGKLTFRRAGHATSWGKTPQLHRVRPTHASGFPVMLSPKK